MIHQDVTSEKRTRFFLPDWIRQRELRQRLPLGNSDVFYKSLYSSILPCQGEEDEVSRSASEHGSLFSLDFCPNGSLLVAGCEKNSFLVFDPLSRKLIRTVHNAHASCVTTVKFLDSRIFATGSVDQTVSLWDARHLKSQIRTLQGHSSTIGNIEYSRKNDLLITTGLNGIIYMWDMKTCIQREKFYKKMFRSCVLLRLRLNPDESKMILSTASGFLMIIHELDFNILTQDLNEFEPVVFASSYLHQPITSSYRSSRFLFPKRRRNHVEIVADFPNEHGLNVISALEIHPQGWSAITRSTCEVNCMEWTCVHDIQDKEFSESGTAPRRGSGDERPPCPQQQRDAEIKRRRVSERLRRANGGLCLKRRPRETRASSLSRALSPPPGPSSGAPPPGALGLACPKSHPASSQLLYPHSFSSSSVSSCVSSNSSNSVLERSDHKGFSRLTHYIEEPFISEWYTENLSVSVDGRLICSPFGRGIRLLTFSPECSEQSVSGSGKQPSCLCELVTNVSHSNIVLCTKFSPRHCLLVSGCLDGKLVWYQPIV